MALKTVVDTLDGFEEAIKALYAQMDDKFVLQVEGVNEHPEVINLKTAYERTKADRDTARQERDAAKALTKELPEDFDAEKWAKLKDGKPDEAALVKLRQTLEAERDDWKGKFTAAQETARRNALDRDLTDALTTAGVTNAMYAKAARGLLADSVKVSDDGKAYVETDMGPVNLTEHVKRWASSEGKDFVTQPSGGGSKGGSGSGPQKKWGELSSSEKVSLHRSNPEEYERIKAAG